MKLNKLTAATLSAVLGLTFVGGVASANDGISFPGQGGKSPDERPILFDDLGIDPKQGPTGTGLVNPPKDPKEENPNLKEGPKEDPRPQLPPKEEKPKPRVERPTQQAPTQQAPAQRTLPRTSAVK